MKDRILMLIARYQNEARGLSASIEEADGLEKDILKARLYTYEMKMIPDLKRILKGEEE